MFLKCGMRVPINAHTSHPGGGSWGGELKPLSYSAVCFLTREKRHLQETEAQGVWYACRAWALTETDLGRSSLLPSPQLLSEGA